MRLWQNLLLFSWIGLVFSNCFSQESEPAYRDPSLPAGQRAADLRKRMTPGEKVDQLTGGRRRALVAADPEAKQVFEELQKLYREDSQVSPDDAAEARNKAQHCLVEKNRLGNPRNFSGRGPAWIHGLWQH